MSLYSAYNTQNADTSYTWLERKLSNICSLCIRNEDYENLNVQYYNENILKIIFQMYSVMCSEYFPNDAKSYMEIDLLNPNVFEPIFHLLDRNETVVHVFYPEQIRLYFNYEGVGKQIEIKQLDSCRKYLLEAKSTTSLLPRVENREPAILLNDLQTTNLIKLYILCDHAMEHLSYYYTNGRDEQNFDKTHVHFGSDTKFLSALITQTPKKCIDEIVYDRSLGAIEELFSIKYEDQEGGDESSDEDDEESDCGGSIAKYLKSM